MMKLIEKHPFPAILPPHATVMMMGTFPPTVEKRCMDFHYPDPAYFCVPGEKRFDPLRIEQFLRSQGIALCSTVQRAIREQGNAADKHLRIVEPVDLTAVLAKLPACRWIFTTGEKATDTLLSLLPNKIKMPKTNEFINFPYCAERELFLYRLPSTSRAYPLSLAKKCEAYRRFFEISGILA